MNSYYSLDEMDIYHAQSQLESLTAHISQAYTKLEEQVITNEKRHIEEKKTISSDKLFLANKLVEKEETLSTLTDKVISQKQQIESLTAEVASQKQQIASLEKQSLEKQTPEPVETPENKFDMLRSQAKEISAKDKEIMRLTKEIVKLKELNEVTSNVTMTVVESPKPVEGWSPTTSTTPKPGKEVPEISLEETHLKVFTDGACSNNGSPEAKAGIGVYFGDNDPRNVSKRIEGKQTNNVAELCAIIEVFSICETEIKQGDKLTIYSDSTIAIGWCTTTGEKYKSKNWTRNKGEIPNVELVKQGYELFKQYPNVTITHVKAHTDAMDELSIGNRNADKLATESLVDDIQNDSEVNEDEVVDEDEDEDEALFEITYRKIKYYRDNNNKVYEKLDDGEPGNYIGDWIKDGTYKSGNDKYKLVKL